MTKQEKLKRTLRNERVELRRDQSQFKIPRQKGARHSQESASGSSSATTDPGSFTISTSLRVLHTRQELHKMRMTLTQPLTLMYAVFVITHLKMTSKRPMDDIDVDDQGRELLCPFCAV